MKLFLNLNFSHSYRSISQKIRVLTESWVHEEIFCPSCGSHINKFGNNRPAADFYCPACKEEFELKSKNNYFGEKIVDGAYWSTIKRLKSRNNPSLFLLSYNSADLIIKNFLVIPKYFFIPDIIEKRKPLAFTAERAGWTGCNILLSSVPQTGKIYYIGNSLPISKEQVMQKWQKILFLKEEKGIHKKTWILDTFHCIDRLNKKDFTLGEIYEFVNYLQLKHPGNHHINDKIRQQLQYLRDKGYLEFLGNGKYRLC